MKLIDLTERRSQRTITMYHGTSSVFVRSILKHGLQANPPKRTYGDNDEFGRIGLETYGGVYLVNSPRGARAHASKTVAAFGGEPMVIEVQYVLGSGEADEDVILGPLNEYFIFLVEMFYEDSTQVSNDGRPLFTEDGGEYESFTEYEQANRKEIVTKIFNWTMDRYREGGTPSREFPHILKDTIIHILEHVDEEHLLAGHILEHFVMGDRSFIERLMRNYRPHVVNTVGRTSVRLTKDIGFRGRTRITGIYLPVTNDWWQNEHSDLTQGAKVIYPRQA